MNYKHVFLGHGDSNKTASAHNAFKIYDEVWVSGQAHIDRFKKSGVNMSGTIIRIIGQPQFNINKIQSQHPEGTFLYIPTWEGTYVEQSYSSLPISCEMFNQEHLNIKSLAIKAHPMTGSKNEEYKKYLDDLVLSLRNANKKIQLYPKDANLINILPEHSGYICDNSATITSSLIFNKPIFVYTPKNLQTANSDISFSDFCYTFCTANEFAKKYTDFLDSGDTLKSNREKVVDYYISRNSTKYNFFRKYTDLILNS